MCRWYGMIAKTVLMLTLSLKSDLVNILCVNVMRSNNNDAMSVSAAFPIRLLSIKQRYLQNTAVVTNLMITLSST